MADLESRLHGAITNIGASSPQTLPSLDLTPKSPKLELAIHSMEIDYLFRSDSGGLKQQQQNLSPVAPLKLTELYTRYKLLPAHTLFQIHWNGS